MNLIFRQANKTDKKDIKRFYKSQQYSAKFMGLDHCFIIEYKCEIVASVIISQLNQQNQQYFLHALVVNSCYQKQGFASKLLKYATDEISTVHKPALIVCFCDANLIFLYQKCGFKLLSENALNQILHSRFLLYKNKVNDLSIVAISYD